MEGSLDDPSLRRQGWWWQLTLRKEPHTACRLSECPCQCVCAGARSYGIFAYFCYFYYRPNDMMFTLIGWYFIAQTIQNQYNSQSMFPLTRFPWWFDVEWSPRIVKMTNIFLSVGLTYVWCMESLKDCLKQVNKDNILVCRQGFSFTIKKKYHLIDWLKIVETT